MKKQLLLLLLVGLHLASCIRNDVFEKNVPVPGHNWGSDFQPVQEFELKDTTSSYNVYVVFRHTNEYKYNNIWVKLSEKQPGSEEWKSKQFDLLLANNDRGWLGTGMDDIFEHRILVAPQTKFIKPGKYQFTIQQVMREDPLPHVMNVGIRIEKVH